MCLASANQFWLRQKPKLWEKHYYYFAMFCICLEADQKRDIDNKWLTVICSWPDNCMDANPHTARDLRWSWSRCRPIVNTRFNWFFKEMLK